MTFWSGWNCKFSKSKFLFFTLLWPKTVEICRNHASKPGKALDWVNLSDTYNKDILKAGGQIQQIEKFLSMEV